MTTFLRAMPLMALLAACGSPQEQCIARATKELRTITALAEETAANLARGYAYETYEITTPVWVICEWMQPEAEGEHPRPRYCFEDETETFTRRIAIDPEAEQRKLAGLRKKDAELRRKVAAEVEACRATYPE